MILCRKAMLNALWSRLSWQSYKDTLSSKLYLSDALNVLQFI